MRSTDAKAKRDSAKSELYANFYGYAAVAWPAAVLEKQTRQFWLEKSILVFFIWDWQFDFHTQFDAYVCLFYICLDDYNFVYCTTSPQEQHHRSIQCDAAITRSIFSKSSHPIARPSGACFFSSKTGSCPAVVGTMQIVISCNIWPRYNGTRLSYPPFYLCIYIITVLDSLTTSY